MFKQRKHKTFNYQSRFSKENAASSNLDGATNTPDFISKWRANSGAKPKVPGAMSTKILVLILLLLLFGMYMLEKKFM